MNHLEGGRPYHHPENPGQSLQPKEQERGERRPLPNVWDTLERRVQLQESYRAGRPARETWTRQQKMAFGKKFTEAQRQQGDELQKLYAAGTARDKLIIDVYTTMAKTSSSSEVSWTNYISPQKTRDLIARLTPMSDEEIVEEVRHQQEEDNRKWKEYHKKHGPYRGTAHF